MCQVNILTFDCNENSVILLINVIQNLQLDDVLFIIQTTASLLQNTITLRFDSLWIHVKIPMESAYVTFIERFVRFVHFKLMSHEPMSLFSSDRHD